MFNINTKKPPKTLDNMAKVVSVFRSGSHTFTKYQEVSIKLLEGLGVEGDAHMGKTVKHRSRVSRDPNQPNLRQIHLIHSELFDELKEQGFNVCPGQMGENITTRGIDLLGLPRDTVLMIGKSAQIKITGLRNPCKQINSIQNGLMNAVIEKDSKGNIVRKAGVMGIVIIGGEVTAEDTISIKLPLKPYQKLERV